ncbi:MAG: hypothetical protein PHE58_07955, partial [Candidatus Omnitrophica bacterium]|nr:hypothetical protein [Candidatus Omnitrophota bacterium]
MTAAEIITTADTEGISSVQISISDYFRKKVQQFISENYQANLGLIVKTALDAVFSNNGFGITSEIERRIVLNMNQIFLGLPVFKQSAFREQISQVTREEVIVSGGNPLDNTGREALREAFFAGMDEQLRSYFEYSYNGSSYRQSLSFLAAEFDLQFMLAGFTTEQRFNLLKALTSQPAVSPLIIAMHQARNPAVRARHTMGNDYKDKLEQGRFLLHFILDYRAYYGIYAHFSGAGNDEVMLDIMKDAWMEFRHASSLSDGGKSRDGLISMSRPDVLIVIGPSGSGKSTFIEHLLALYPEKYAFPLLLTTRNPRPGEKVGKYKLPVSGQVFSQKRNENKLILYRKSHGYEYGMERTEINKYSLNGTGMVFDTTSLNTFGLIKREFPDARVVLVLPSSLESIHAEGIEKINSLLMERIKNRGDTDQTEIMKRETENLEFLRHCAEIPFDVVIINDSLHTIGKNKEYFVSEVNRLFGVNGGNDGGVSVPKGEGQGRKHVKEDASLSAFKQGTQVQATHVEVVLQTPPLGSIKVEFTDQSERQKRLTPEEFEQKKQIIVTAVRQARGDYDEALVILRNNADITMNLIQLGKFVSRHIYSSVPGFKEEVALMREEVLRKKYSAYIDALTHAQGDFQAAHSFFIASNSMNVPYETFLSYVKNELYVKMPGLRKKITALRTAESKTKKETIKEILRESNGDYEAAAEIAREKHNVDIGTKELAVYAQKTIYRVDPEFKTELKEKREQEDFRWKNAVMHSLRESEGDFQEATGILHLLYGYDVTEQDVKSYTRKTLYPAFPSFRDEVVRLREKNKENKKSIVRDVLRRAQGDFNRSVRILNEDYDIEMSYKQFSSFVERSIYALESEFRREIEELRRIRSEYKKELVMIVLRESSGDYEEAA